MELVLLLLELFIASLALSEETAVEEAQGSHGESSGIHQAFSLPFLPKDGDYKDQGGVVNLGDLPVYVVGDSTKAVVWNYDIFGFDAGRTRQMADLLAASGFLVAIPDYFRGGPQVPGQPFDKDLAVRVSNWTQLEADWTLRVHPYLAQRGATSFGSIGTCWGNYVTVKLSTLPEFAAGVSMHPSHPPIMALLGENEEETLRSVRAPQLFMPARTDSPSVKPGGLAETILGDRAKIVEFPEMEHGWTVRGNLSDPAVARDVAKAMTEAISFFNNHL